MSASRLLRVAFCLALIPLVLAEALNEPTILAPGMTPTVHLPAPKNGDRVGAYFAINTTLPDPMSGWTFFVSRDTTRAPLVCYWSTTKTHPSWIGSDPSFTCGRQNNANRFSPFSTTYRTPLPFKPTFIHLTLHTPPENAFRAQISLFPISYV